MEIRESVLPGVGKKFIISLNDTTDLIIVIHNTGRREVFLDKNKEEDNVKLFTLSDQQARVVGTILEGAYFQPVVTEDKSAPMDDQTIIEWYMMESGNRLTGRSLNQINADDEIDIQVIACKEDGKSTTTSEQETVLEIGDTIIVVGSKEQHDRFKQYIQA